MLRRLIAIAAAGLLLAFDERVNLLFAIVSPPETAAQDRVAGLYVLIQVEDIVGIVASLQFPQTVQFGPNAAATASPAPTSSAFK